MDQTFKIIDISGGTSNKPKKKLSKKQIYKEILSSSDKVQEIINNRKKTKRFDYLNMIPKINENESKVQITQQPPTPKANSAQIENTKQEEKKINTSKPKPVKRKPRVKKKKTPSSESEKKLKNSKINDFFKPEQTKIENKIIEKAGETIILQNKAYTKTSNVKQKNIPSKENVRIPKRRQLKSQPKQFTPNQIKEIIKILFKLNNFEQYSKIHKTIRRLNKIKINQLLYALRLIKKFSNAPDNLLKNTLFNYITSDIKVQLS